MTERLAQFRAFIAALLTLALPPIAARAAVPCERLSFEGTAYTVCRVDARERDLRLFLNDAAGRPYGSFARLARDLGERGEALAFAMNGGMYHADRSPVGLHVEGARELSPLSTRDGPGNFHLKPNGVFWIEGDRVDVSESEAYAEAEVSPDFATQSGPMLVIDGALHPRFIPGGTSRKLRNGVGACGPHEAVFAISEDRVNFHDFARLFRDRLGCDNALYLDGVISALHAPALGRTDRGLPMGPIVGVVEKE